MIAFSSVSSIQLRLPAGDLNSSQLHLTVVIRDQLDCVTRVNLSSVLVTTDSTEIDQLLRSLNRSTSGNALTSDPLVQILYSGNQNAVGQVINSLSQHFNRLNTQALQETAASA